MLELLDLPTCGDSIEEAKTMIKRAQWQDPSIEAKIDGLMMQAVHETSHLLESDGNNSFRSENWASLASSIKFKKHAISQEVQLPAGMFEQPPEKKVIYQTQKEVTLKNEFFSEQAPSDDLYFSASLEIVVENPYEDELVSIGELNVQDIQIEEEKMEPPIVIRSIKREHALLLLVPQRHDDPSPVTKDELILQEPTSPVENLSVSSGSQNEEEENQVNDANAAVQDVNIVIETDSDNLSEFSEYSFDDLDFAELSPNLPNHSYSHDDGASKSLLILNKNRQINIVSKNE